MKMKRLNIIVICFSLVSEWNFIDASIIDNKSDLNLIENV